MRAPWVRRRPPEYFGASEFEKQQWVAGIPARFWNTQFASVNPRTFQYEHRRAKVTAEGETPVDSVSAQVQAEYLQARIDNPELMDSNRLVCMTSLPSDEQALAAACLLATSYIKSKWPSEMARVRVDDIQDYEACLAANRRDFYSVEPDILVIYNLHPYTPKDRLSKVRDLILKFEGAYRVIVAAGENPFEFARDTLYVEPHEAYHFEGKPAKVRKA